MTEKRNGATVRTTIRDYEHTLAAPFTTAAFVAGMVTREMTTVNGQTATKAWSISCRG